MKSTSVPKWGIYQICCRNKEYSKVIKSKPEEYLMQNEMTVFHNFQVQWNTILL